MSEIIHRLIEKDKIVGYEYHIPHAFNLISIIHVEPEFLGADVLTIYNNDRFNIPHTRKDRWTGQKYPDGRLVFERDLTEDEYGEKGVVLYYEGEAQYRVFIEGLGSFEISDNKGLAFLGVEGVKESEDEKV